VALNTLKPTNQQNIIGKNKMGEKMVGIIPQSNKKLQNCKSIYSTPNTQMLVGFKVFNATFNNISAISWRSVLLVKEIGGAGENHRPVAI
jgi:hypothetical protein